MTTPPRLTPVRRARVIARRSLYAGLQAVPGRLVLAVHDRWIDSAGRRDARWRALASALFYRPIPQDDVLVPGGRGERLAVVGTRIERRLWWYGEAGYEEGEAGRWRALCAASNNVLEVGANIGYYSVVGAKATGGTYTTVEANPEAAAVVRQNLVLNGLTGVEVVQSAMVASDAPAELELAFPDQETHSVAPLGSFLREGTESVADRAATRSVMVPTVPAATMFAGRDLVKLDIEGSEAAVLEDALEEIRRSRPILLVELLAGSDRLRGVLSTIADEGYGVHLPSDGSRALSREELAVVGDRDVLLVPRERTSVLRVNGG